MTALFRHHNELVKPPIPQYLTSGYRLTNYVYYDSLRTEHRYSTLLVFKSWEGDGLDTSFHLVHCCTLISIWS